MLESHTKFVERLSGGPSTFSKVHVCFVYADISDGTETFDVIFARKTQKNRENIVFGVTRVAF